MRLLSISIELGNIQGSETDIKVKSAGQKILSGELYMKVQLFDITGLTITQSAKLFSITEDKFDLKAQFVEAINVARLRLV